MHPNPLTHIMIILHQPHDVINIGGVIRAMKNMGLHQLRLVNPVPFDPSDITGIAHRSQDVLANMEIHTSLDNALADVGYLVGTTARRRGNHPVRDDLRTLAPNLLARTTQSPVALLFGPEDNGLDNTTLDRCNLIVTLPADPSYSSLNLAQAVLLFAYELYMANQAVHIQPPPPTPSAGVEQMQQLFSACQNALQAIEFFKNGQTEHSMRTLRTLIYRAAPNQRETALLTAMAREVVAYIQRKARP